MIDINTSRDVSILNNEIKVKNTGSSAAGVYLTPPTTSGPTPTYDISYNTITGLDSGKGVYALGTGSANYTVQQNTIARFETGVLIQRGSTATSKYTALVNGNAIVNSSDYAFYTALNGSDDKVTATGNCFADNGDWAIGCQTQNTINATGNFWGHESGPRINSNPDGKGEGVFCPNIDVSAWLTDHSCALSGLDISGIEAVQSVQTIENAVPLVENKPTMVRVYPSVDTGSTSVQGELTAFRNGTQLGTLQSTAPARAGVIDDWNAVRAYPESSLNFRLPENWLNGTLDLIATLDLDTSAASMDAGKPTLQTTIEFAPRKKFKIGYIPITIDTGVRQYPVDAGDILDLHRQIMSIYPFGDVEFKIYPEETIFYSSVPAFGSNQASGNGLLHYSIQVKGHEYREGDFEADAYITVNSVNDDSFKFTYVPFDLSVSQCSTMAEGRYCLYNIGKILNLRLLPRLSDPEGYPWTYSDNMTQEYGMDVLTGQLQSPELWDVMSWESIIDERVFRISPFHYERGFNNLTPDPSTAVQTAQVGADTLWVTGVAAQDDARSVSHIESQRYASGVDAKHSGRRLLRSSNRQCISRSGILLLQSPAR